MLFYIVKLVVIMTLAQLRYDCLSARLMHVNYYFAAQCMWVCPSVCGSVRQNGPIYFE